jgi:hypothetical protein
MERVMTKQPPTLEERIDIAFQPNATVTSADLYALIEEAESDIAKADQLWKTPHQTSPLDSETRQLINRYDPRRGSTTAVAAQIAGPLRAGTRARASGLVG